MELDVAAEAPAVDFPMKRRKPRTRFGSNSKYIVVQNDDLLTQILLRLPSYTVIDFKSVCRSWNSLISSRRFCVLWQQHRAPRLLLGAPYLRSDSHCFISLFGSNIGQTQFRMPCNTVNQILQSCNGFLLLESSNEYCIYNPTTLERFTLPQLGNIAESSLGMRARVLKLKGGDDWEIDLGHCGGEIDHVNLAFDKSWNGRAVALASYIDRDECVYQIYVAEFGGEWRHSGKVFECKRGVVEGVYWNNSIIWIGFDFDVIVCFDLDGEQLRVGAPPPRKLGNFYYFGESGGHLHFAQWEDCRRTLVVHEMMTDLSGWIVRYSISSSHIDPSFSSDFDHRQNMKVVTLIELDEDSAVLVLEVGRDFISYRIQDRISRKLCGAALRSPTLWNRRKSYAAPHVESILQFHSSSLSNLIC